MFWSDRVTATIEKANLQGKERRVLKSTQLYVNTIALDSTFLYFTGTVDR